MSQERDQEVIAKLQEWKRPQKISLLMAGFGALGVLDTSLTSASGAGFGLLNTKYGNHTLTVEEGAAYGALSAGIPFAIAWLALPAVTMYWVYGKIQKLQNPESNSFMGTKNLVMLMTVAQCLLTMTTGFMLAAVTGQKAISGFGWGLLALGIMYLTAYGAAAIAGYLVNQSEEQEPLTGPSP